jgi:hypothetical protein
MFPAHIDHQAHTQVMQELVVLLSGGCADEQVVRDFRKIHRRNLITGNGFSPIFSFFP